MHKQAEELDQRRPLLFSVEQATKTLGVSRSPVYEMLRTGELESVALHRRRLIPASALDDLVERLRSVTS